MAAEIVDDIHVITYERGNDGGIGPSGDASVVFYVDGDKSGGGPLFEPSREKNMQQAQIYKAFARTYNNDSMEFF